VLLLVACGAIAWEAIMRLASPPVVAGATVMGVAGVGIVLNGISAWLLHGGSHGDLNRRSAFLHMLGDAAISAGVLVSGGLIVYTGWNWLDPWSASRSSRSSWRRHESAARLDQSVAGRGAEGVNSTAVMSFLSGQPA